MLSQRKEFLDMKKMLVLALSLQIIVGCSSATKEARTELQAKLPKFSHALDLPTPKGVALLRQSASSMVTHLSPRATTGGLEGLKAQFRSTFFREIIRVGGLPRRQTEAVLQHVVSSPACDGVSCSRILGIAPNEVGPYLDQVKKTLISDSRPKDTDEIHNLKTLISSVTPESEIILATRIGQQAGSNAGGFYKGLDEVTRYVKFYNDPAQAHGEHLANLIYRDLGVPAPDSVIFPYENRIAFASVVIADARELGGSASKVQARKIVDGYLADVLTANWDVVGLGGSNIIIRKDGTPVRIDNGGTFLMRAMNGRKPSGLLDTVSEWDNFRNGGVNPSYAAIFAKADLKPLEFKTLAKEQLGKILALRSRYDNWSGYVAKKVPGYSGVDHDQIVRMLESRTRLLEQKLSDP
jgi:hypothetical protein